MWGVLGIVLDPFGNLLPLDESTVNLVGRVNLRFDSWKNPLDEVWYRSPILNMFRGEEWLPDSCRKCPLKRECRGGSRVNAFLFTKNIYNMDPFCPKSRYHGVILKMFEGD